ncbi:MAG: energy-coupling factor transporter transmembrane protein EcfT [Clostridia bacterium]|nr:energy-coupling factor transporter transmembrane protein EcfT [Clostridia bacterium]
MTRSITLGQYYPGRSLLHRADGRMKLILVIIFMASCFCARSLFSFGLLTLFTLLLVFISTVPLGLVLRSVRMIIYILVLTFFLNVFFTSGEGEPLFSWWIFKAYREGLWRAAFMAVRVLDLVTGTSVLISFTSSPVDVTHSIEALLKPLSKIGLPVHVFSMMMFIALRFIPTLADDADRIITAQKSRGLDLRSGSPVARVKSLVSVIVPLFVSSFRRADELAVAMECRCYHGGDGRTSLRVMRFRALDFAALVFFAALLAGTILLNRVKTGYSL